MVEIKPGTPLDDLINCPKGYFEKCFPSLEFITIYEHVNGQYTPHVSWKFKDKNDVYHFDCMSFSNAAQYATKDLSGNHRMYAYEHKYHYNIPLIYKLIELTEHDTLDLERTTDISQEYFYEVIYSHKTLALNDADAILEDIVDFFIHNQKA